EWGMEGWNNGMLGAINKSQIQTSKPKLWKSRRVFQSKGNLAKQVTEMKSQFLISKNDYRGPKL
ncbi:MAG: hypothetical protein KAJ51_05920, partial [Thermoplasmata archaeon]|nr:hypothetical protein [Thermoplasmata archaeon]